jgi:hypothetical protein
LADADADGALSAREAVAFLTRSGLPRDALARIWCARGARARRRLASSAEP